MPTRSTIREVWRGPQDERAQSLHVRVSSYIQTEWVIRDEWIQQVIEHPIKEVIQKDGRIRRWAPISETGGKYLRVILLPDGETVHNAFFDRSFTL
jgi:hypothetical protein